ncbi:MAG TPA: hypothetical protein VHG90_13730 [Acidimicrobiales bacterium]|nr:hypothetical protein [Acidimicrobiales bacterium]
MEPADFLGIPVVVADNVADYCAATPAPNHLMDLVTTVAPPFRKFFIECAPRTPPSHGITPLHAWGFLGGSADLTDAEWRAKVPDRRLLPVLAAFSDVVPAIPAELADVPVRWVLQLIPFLEVRKSRPMGPVAEYSFALDDEGCLIGQPDGGVVGVEGLVGLTSEPTANLPAFLMELLDNQLIPVLFAISLMHCRNVTLRTVEPAQSLSRKAQRRSGHPLLRYQVLEISPMRRILETEGAAMTKGLGHALHICRGHFKTYTRKAPLFGKHVGRYWWSDVARGTPARGVVTSDYRVTVDADLVQAGPDGSSGDDRPRRLISAGWGRLPSL